MNAYQRVILEHHDGTIGELRIYPDHVEVWYQDQIFTGYGSLLRLFNNLQKGVDWDGIYFRIQHLVDKNGVCEGVKVTLYPIQDLLLETAKNFVLFGNKKILLKRLKIMFAANI